ncbi:hypothetical protein [uncultured Ligilactobacillus sp.]|uniref:hypothetical protein n=1 Tax=uncultured Ligilactobacillus sp. TaxID=2837633 RepID=UPI003390758C
MIDLEKEHKGTLDYPGMTTKLSSEKRLYFKASINRVTNCMRSNRITSNVRRKKRSRIRRSMTTLKSLKHQFRAQ